MMHVPDRSRRRIVTAFGATTAVVWVAPSVIGLDRVAAASASAATPAFTGAATAGTLASGQSVRPNSTQYSSNTQFFVFEEACVTLATGQATDSGDVLPTGQLITSHLIHFSPASGGHTLVGSVTFDGTIVGYDWTDATLAATDAQWGVGGVNYGVGGRRLELPGQNVVNDTLAITAPGTVDLSLRAGESFADQLRVYVIH